MQRSFRRLVEEVEQLLQLGGGRRAAVPPVTAAWRMHLGQTGGVPRKPWKAITARGHNVVADSMEPCTIGTGPSTEAYMAWIVA